MRASSMAIRLCVLEDCDAGLGTRSVACKYRVSESWVRRLKQRRREDHRLTPRPAGNPTPAKLNGYHPPLHVAAASTLDRLIHEIGRALMSIRLNECRTTSAVVEMA